MAPSPRTVSPGQRFDAYVEKAIQLSKLGSLGGAAGALLLYLTGVALHTVSSSLLGAPLFEFTLNRCLEQGLLNLTEFGALTPLVAVLGFVHMATTPYMARGLVLWGLYGLARATGRVRSRWLGDAVTGILWLLMVATLA